MTDETSLIAGVEKRVAIFGGVLAIVAAVVPLGVSMARVDPAIAEIQSTIQNDRQNREKANDATNARIDRIEESRSVGLQRLSKVEEAMQTTKDTLAQINGKLDRMLMRR